MSQHPQEDFLPDLSLNEAVTAVAELSHELVELGHEIRDYARSSHVEDIETKAPERVTAIRAAMGRAAGLPVYGSYMLHVYYRAQTDVYERGFLPGRRQSYPLQAVMRAAGSVPLPAATKAENRYAIAFDPLYTLGHRGLSRYYAERGWHNQLRQPFASPDNQDERLFLPVEVLSPEGLQLLELPWTLRAAKRS